ncbi:hypothetical protein B7463_g10333, partial [Scytalidium lignicola]
MLTFSTRRYSKKYINELYGRIDMLENAITAAREESRAAPAYITSADLPTAPVLGASSLGPKSAPAIARESSIPYSFCLESSKKLDNVISRLCGRRRQFTTDDFGRLRFFGPSSSIHVTESVSSSIFHHCDTTGKFRKPTQGCVPLVLQEYLLSHYWTYQHNVLPVVYKEAFLRDKETERGPYYSKCLMYCIFVSAARTCERSELRALSLPPEDGESDQPLLLKQATVLLEEELKNPGITTIQLWSIYLGRPPCINLADVTVPRISIRGSSSLSWELSIFAAWVNLVEIGGRICGILNGTSISELQSTLTLTEQLKDWNSQQLELSLQNTKLRTPAIYHLQIEFCAFMILLHRPSAGFGIGAGDASDSSNVSRETCVEHAIQLALHVQDFQRDHGSASKMLGSALYNISLAATTLLVNLAEQKSTGLLQEYTSLMTCLKAFKEMEDTEDAARRVGKIIQSVMRIYNLHSQPDEGKLLEDAAQVVREQNNSIASNESHKGVTDVQQFLDSEMGIDWYQSNPSTMDGMFFPSSLDNLLQMDFNLDELFPVRS